MSDTLKYFTRMGDGNGVYMTEEEIRRDIEEGVADAVRRGKIEALTEDEKEQLYNIVIMEGNVVGVKRDSLEIARKRVREILGGPVTDALPEDIQERIDAICAEADAGL